MPRPDDFTPELQAFCDEEMTRYLDEQRRGLIPAHDRIPEGMFTVPHFREAWYSGTWLDRKLTALGCQRDEIRRICFANGQKCAMVKDAWPVAQRTLADYQAGRPMDAPGPGLAGRLLEAPGAQLDAELVEQVIEDLLSK